MKAIMISDHAKWCALMMNGDKTVEVRKENVGKAVQKLIDEQGFADIYVYCSKNEYLYRTNKGYFASKKPLAVGKGTDYTFAYSDEGKVLFKFRCYKVEEIEFFDEYLIPNGYEDYDGEWVDTSITERNVHDIDNRTLQKTCLTYEELQNYLGDKNGYAIHISDLVIFDKPKELSEFRPSYQGKCLTSKCKYCDEYGYCEVECKDERLTKAPQSYMFIEAE